MVEQVEMNARMGLIHVDGQCFRDDAGRQVILRGINLYAHAWGDFVPEAADFARIRDWGFDSVRLVLFWSRLEPEPGRYDEEAFAEVDRCLDLAGRHDLGVLLDMHQDLWGGGIPGSRGAPDWTVLDPSLPHVSDGPVWSAAYFQSPLVQSAFDDFWRNAPGPDGVGLQDRFALVWRYLAERVVSSPAVIGYDLLNEPFPGTPIHEVLHALSAAMETRIDADTFASASELERGLLALQAAEADPAAFREFLAAGEPLVQHLDRTLLQPMAERVTAAIREVDPHHPVATCPYITANLGFQPGFGPIADANDVPDPQQIFAPHIYADDPGLAALITDRLLERAAANNVPLLIGEWGNLDNSDGIFDGDPLPATRVMLERLEAAGASTMYWAYERNLDRHPFFEEFLQRPHIRAVSGTLRNCQVSQNQFSCTWDEDPAITAATEVMLPARVGATPNITLPEGNSPVMHAPLPGGNTLLTIPPTGRAGTRTLTVTW